MANDLLYVYIKGNGIFHHLLCYKLCFGVVRCCYFFILCLHFILPYFYWDIFNTVALFMISLICLQKKKSIKEPDSVTDLTWLLLQLLLLLLLLLLPLLIVMVSRNAGTYLSAISKHDVAMRIRVELSKLQYGKLSPELNNTKLIHCHTHTQYGKLSPELNNTKLIHCHTHTHTQYSKQ